MFELAYYLTGWTLMDNVYVFKGTLYIVSDDPERDRIPHIQNMISSGKPIRKEPGDEHRREPTDQNMQVITSRQAHQMFGTSVKRVEGTSVSPMSFDRHVDSQINAYDRCPTWFSS